MSIISDALGDAKFEYVPSIFIKYARGKEIKEVITTSALIAIDAITIYKGVPAFLVASNLRKGWIGFEIANAAGNIALNLTPEEAQNEVFKSLVEASDMLMLGVGVKDLGLAGGKALAKIYQNTLKYRQQVSKELVTWFVSAYLRAKQLNPQKTGNLEPLYDVFAKHSPELVKKAETYYLEISLAELEEAVRRVNGAGQVGNGLTDIVNLFSKNNPANTIKINGKTFSEVVGVVNGKTVKMFQGATDAEIRIFAENLAGKPLTQSADGKVFTAITDSGVTINLRNISSSSQQTGAKWTVDIRNSNILLNNKGKSIPLEIKFR